MKKRNVIGGNLKYLRKKCGLSQEQFVAKLHLIGLDLDRTALSRIENYTRIVYDYEVLYFAEILNLDVTELYKSTYLNHKK